MMEDGQQNHKDPMIHNPLPVFQDPANQPAQDMAENTWFDQLTKLSIKHIKQATCAYRHESKDVCQHVTTWSYNEVPICDHDIIALTILNCESLELFTAAMLEIMARRQRASLEG